MQQFQTLVVQKERVGFGNGKKKTTQATEYISFMFIDTVERR